MTHGEEPGPETHKDSAVLTYLEGLLMHPVVAGPGAAATRRSEAAHSNQEQADKAGGPFQPPVRGPAAPKAGANGPSLGASQHLKKARLLRSGAWGEAGGQRTATPPVTPAAAAAAQLNGQGGGGQNGALDGSPHAGESTLLASLLQSFSSRLQSVALSQHAGKPPPAKAAEPLPAYGTASSRLKGLMRKSKVQGHSSTPYSRQAAGHGQDRPPESPRSARGATPPSGPPAGAAEAVSCADRLKAVANMVKIRSSPAPSPKPSVACSQLALLLSSEAHLQQYSREHALKAQLSGRSASERLAAMATQQQVGPQRPSSAGEAPPDPLGPFASQNGAAAKAPRPTLSSPQSPSVLRGPGQTSPPPPPPRHAPSHAPAQPPREKRPSDSRPSRPPQTCSSLLLLLLNNHNSQRQLTKNGHLEEEEGGGGLLLPPPSCSSSATSDSECSAQERSLAKDSSDAESSYSSCSPIDLSVRSRAGAQDTAGPKTSTSAAPPCSSSMSSSSSTSTSSLSSSAVFSSARAAFSPPPCPHPASNALASPTVISSAPSSSSSSTCCSSSFSAPSLDRMTESLINKWKPEPCGSKVARETSPDRKSHPKLTLMQLLLERRNNSDKGSKSGELPLDVTMATMSSMSRGPGPKGSAPAGLWDESRTGSPLGRPGPAGQPLYPSGALSPFSYSSPGVQSSPLDLCKSKAFPAEKASEPAFSASKLLQNLAQCGTASPSPPAGPAGRAPGPPDADACRPLALLERLNAPVHRSTATPLSDGPSGSGTPFSHGDGASPLASSQIENLLERRTVLQLLLGTGSAAACTRQDRAGRGSAEVLPAAVCDSSNGPSADVKVKTERAEEARPPTSASATEDFNGRKRRGGGKASPVLSEPPPDFKMEPPRPTEVIAKYGLLSQLLKQQTATYYTSAAAPVKEEQQQQGDYRGPSPKKRRLFPERVDGLGPAGPAGAGDGREGGDCCHGLASALQEEPRHRRTPKEEEEAARSTPTDSLARESRSFNVLKQLLLSDNCLKELSQQPRASGSPSVLQANGKANGSISHPIITAPVPSQQSHNHSFLHPPWNPAHPPLSSGLHGNLRPLPNNNSSSSNNNNNNNNNSSSSLQSDTPLRLPWDHHPAPWPVSQKRDAPTLVKQEPESPARWSGQEEEDEGGDSNPDSPRLTRSNPILYYMLQKGSAQLRRELREQAEGTQPVARVKEEPVGDVHAYEHRLSSAPHSPAHNHKHSHKSHGLSQSSD